MFAIFSYVAENRYHLLKYQCEQRRIPLSNGQLRNIYSDVLKVGSSITWYKITERCITRCAYININAIYSEFDSKSSVNIFIWSVTLEFEHLENSKRTPWNYG